jgi:predicted Zn-dependent protease
MPYRPITLVLGLAIAAACAVNPVTGKRELSLVSESQEIRMGLQGAESVVNSLGLYPDSGLQAYVSVLGLSMARLSERPQLPWSFQVINDPVVNAFALPGGPIFVTRGILTHFNTEAELMSVLGHEIGHITAKHSVSQISQAQLAQLGLGVGMILTPELDVLHQVAGTGLQVLFLKFGRDDESQSDELGFRYLVAAGYDPREATSMFETLDRLSGGGRIPEWQSTHPDPANRVEHSQERVIAMPEDPATLRVGRDDYLRHIDGVIFGSNPREGFFDGDWYHHPDLRFRLELPADWKKQNLSQAVIGMSQAGDAVFQVTLVEATSPHAAAIQFFRQLGISLDASSSNPINGLEAETRYFTYASQEATIQGLVGYIDYHGQVYQLLGYSTAISFGRYRITLANSVASFREETDQAVLDVEPDRIELVRLPRQMTVEEFYQRYPSTIPIEKIALINGVELDDTMAGGLLVKRVVP